MARWVCPRCDREFDRPNRGHTCVPGGSVEDTFAGRTRQQRAIYDRIVEHLRTLGPVHEDAVTVGVFLKADRKLAEVRPRSRDVQVWLLLPDREPDPRFSRIEPTGRERVAHLLSLREPDEVDDQLRGWLTEAYLFACDGRQ